MLIKPTAGNHHLPKVIFTRKKLCCVVITVRRGLITTF